MYLRFRRAPPAGEVPAKLHDPPALEAGLGALGLDISLECGC